ncbi:hypothetical protein GCM10027456_25880 [Kineosporia babensis]
MFWAHLLWLIPAAGIGFQAYVEAQHHRCRHGLTHPFGWKWHVFRASGIAYLAMSHLSKAYLAPSAVWVAVLVADLWMLSRHLPEGWLSRLRDRVSARLPRLAVGGAQ